MIISLFVLLLKLRTVKLAYISFAEDFKLIHS